MCQNMNRVASIYLMSVLGVTRYIIKSRMNRKKIDKGAYDQDIVWCQTIHIRMCVHCCCCSNAPKMVMSITHVVGQNDAFHILTYTHAYTPIKWWDQFTQPQACGSIAQHFFFCCLQFIRILFLDCPWKFQTSYHNHSHIAITSFTTATTELLGAHILGLFFVFFTIRIESTLNGK